MAKAKMTLQEAFEIVNAMLEHTIQTGLRGLSQKCKTENLPEPFHVIAYDSLGELIGESEMEETAKGVIPVFSATEDAFLYASPIKFELTAGDGRKVSVVVAAEAISQKQKEAPDAGATPEEVGISHFDPTRKQ